MLLARIDWMCVGGFFLISLIIGLAVSRKAGSSMREFFLAGNRMPWWLLGVSMVATTFSTDTPNLVSNIVRKNGVAGNWVWWAFLLTGLLTVFVYSRLWKRSGVMTDIEFYELRYSGKSAAFLRGFRAVYLGLVFNIIIMASVSLAAIKIGAVLLGLTPIQTILVASTVTVIYCSLGGLEGVLLTDFLQFCLAMFGSIMAAIIAVRQPEVGGLSGLLSHEAVREKLSLFPNLSNRDALISLFIVPFFVSWWSVWYPGSEPGGGGFIAQRMLAARNERHALGAVFLFNAAHYALRPWPWIIVALCSIVVFPDLDSLRAAFPQSAAVVDHDLGYPAMLTFLPHGLLGLVVASLAAAYMSTISTHLNWGASYLVHDVYQRFVNPESSDRELVLFGRIATVVLMILAGTLALFLQSALDSFNIILQIGAGTGLLFILRWFWWRINAVSEITAMVVSFLVAVGFHIVTYNNIEIPDWVQLCVGVAITTVAWIGVTLLTRPAHMDKLVEFYRLVHPGGPGWRAVAEYAREQGIGEELSLAWQMPTAILCIILSVMAIYSTLFATGYWIYGNVNMGMIFSTVAVVATVLLVSTWRRLTASSTD